MLLSVVCCTRNSARCDCQSFVTRAIRASEGTKLNTASTRAPLSGPNTAKTLDAIVMGAAPPAILHRRVRTELFAVISQPLALAKAHAGILDIGPGNSSDIRPVIQ